MTDQEVQKILDDMREEVGRNITITNLEELEGYLIELKSEDFRMGVKSILGTVDAVDTGNTIGDLIINLLKANEAEEGSLDYKSCMNCCRLCSQYWLYCVAGLYISIWIDENKQCIGTRIS